MLVDDDGLPGAAGQVDVLDEQGYFIVVVQVGPELFRPGLSVRGLDGHLPGLALEGGQRVQVLLIGVDEVASAGHRGVVLIEVAVVAAGITVSRLQDG